MAEVAAFSPEQREKYLEAGAPRSDLRRRDPEETKAQAGIRALMASGCQGLSVDALPQLYGIKKKKKKKVLPSCLGRST